MIRQPMPMGPPGGSSRGQRRGCAIASRPSVDSPGGASILRGVDRSFSGIAAGLVLGLLSVALTLVIAEWVLRATILPVESVDPLAQVALVRDPVVGYRLRPNQRTIMTNGHFSEEVRTDEAGLRDFYDERYSNPGIIAIGDSQTFGHGERVEATWVEQLQENLGKNVL